MPNIDIGNIFFRCLFSYRKVLKDFRFTVLDLLEQSQKCHYLCHTILLDGNMFRIFGCLCFSEFFSARHLVCSKLNEGRRIVGRLFYQGQGKEHCGTLHGLIH